ncbi:CU044_2847 family protein [Niveibacterium sp. SC-1]|uniref:CU044_2847 family protein n=1 Tax=Niveibacterium sp. SC-1 TaxID=3135646 RepID=UPI00311F9A86
MASHYIRFDTADGQTLLVEAEVEELASPGGVVKAGVGDKIRETIAAARDSLDGAMRRAVSGNARAIIEAVQDLPRPPSEIEISFGLKVTGEAGNIAVGKAGSDVNYQVKLVWKQT